MRTIWKYKLMLIESQSLFLPKHAEILTAQIQNGDISIWALLDPEKEQELVRFAIRGTGHRINGDEGRYIATVQKDGFVWHIFATEN